MPRKRHVYTAPELVDSNSEKRTGTWDRFKKLGSVLVLLATIPSIISFVRNDPKLGQWLLLIPTLVLFWAAAPAMRACTGKAYGFVKAQLVVWFNARRLRDHAEQFWALIDQSQSTAFNNILFSICENSWEETDKLVPRAEIITQWFKCFTYDLDSPIWRFRRFARLTHQLTWIVSAYNQYYVLSGQRKLRQCTVSRQDPNSLQELNLDEIDDLVVHERKGIPSHYKDRLSSFREHYVRFLLDFTSWLRGMNKTLGPKSSTSFLASYEEPGQF